MFERRLNPSFYRRYNGEILLNGGRPFHFDIYIYVSYRDRVQCVHLALHYSVTLNSTVKIGSEFCRDFNDLPNELCTKDKMKICVWKKKEFGLVNVCFNCAFLLLFSDLLCVRCDSIPFGWNGESVRKKRWTNWRWYRDIKSVECWPRSLCAKSIIFRLYIATVTKINYATDYTAFRLWEKADGLRCNTTRICSNHRQTVSDLY